MNIFKRAPKKIDINATITVNLNITLNVPVCPVRPASPRIFSNTFLPGVHSMAQRTGTIQLSGQDPTATSIPVVITGSSVPGMSPVTVDALNPANSFQCNDGDVLVEIGTQITPGGESDPSAPLTFVVAAGVVLPGLPPVKPLPPVLVSNTFV